MLADSNGGLLSFVENATDIVGRKDPITRNLDAGDALQGTRVLHRGKPSALTASEITEASLFSIADCSRLLPLPSMP